MKKKKVFKMSWELSKFFWANSYLDLGFLEKPKTEPIRISYILVIPTFIIILIFLLIYVCLEGLGIIKIIEWLFSRSKE
jgi:hypothetical protein